MTKDKIIEKVLKELEVKKVVSAGKKLKVKGVEWDLFEVLLKNAMEKALQSQKDKFKEEIEKCKVIEIRQDLEQEGVEYHLIDKKELLKEVEK